MKNVESQEIKEEVKEVKEEVKVIKDSKIRNAANAFVGGVQKHWKKIAGLAVLGAGAIVLAKKCSKKHENSESYDTEHSESFTNFTETEDDSVESE